MRSVTLLAPNSGSRTSSQHREIVGTLDNKGIDISVPIHVGRSSVRCSFSPNLNPKLLERDAAPTLNPKSYTRKPSTP